MYGVGVVFGVWYGFWGKCRVRGKGIWVWVWWFGGGGGGGGGVCVCVRDIASFASFEHW